jgi:FtsP/CotA-like multicopper oxidase with cupredoxin domain
LNHSVRLGLLVLLAGVVLAGTDAWAAVKTMRLAAGDGYITMADRRESMYIFGFSDITGVPEAQVFEVGALGANSPAPTIILDEGDEFYLQLTNVGMMMRPDLFDAHSVHWHGLPNSSPIFDGLPESAVVINMGATLTYYYKVTEPGTYLYHCHVEATEHMQMGMIGNLWVRPAQNVTGAGPLVPPGKYVYNDGDGSTAYDREFPLQFDSFDSNFHDASITVQYLPFYEMKGNYPLINGRGYPDTVAASVPAPPENGDRPSQPVGSLIACNAGDRVLLRISNVSVTEFYTVATSGVPFTVVGKDAKLLRGPTGLNLSYTTSSLTLGGGESADVIFTAPAIQPPLNPAGYETYVFYTTNLNHLSNNTEDFGGLMTEIRVYPAGTLPPQTF